MSKENSDPINSIEFIKGEFYCRVDYTRAFIILDELRSVFCVRMALGLNSSSYFRDVNSNLQQARAVFTFPHVCFHTAVYSPIRHGVSELQISYISLS